jgi:DNA repair protein RadC
MARRLLGLSVWLILCSFAAVAQAAEPQHSPDPPAKAREDPWSNGQDSAVPEDMRLRMAMERAESDHRKILGEVDKLHELSSEVARGYQEHGKLSSDDLKKVTTIEKLAKRVLNHALGDEVTDDSPKPLTLAEAIDRMKTVAAKINKAMKGESRFEVSAVVIADSNEVIRLANIIKRTQNK